MFRNARSYTIHGTAAAGSLVKVWEDANHNGVVDSGETVAGSQQLGSTATSYSISVNLTLGTTTNNADNHCWQHHRHQQTRSKESTTANLLVQ